MSKALPWYSSIASIAPTVATLRGLYNSNAMQSAESRRKALHGLFSMLDEKAGQLHQAVFKDLHKHPVECDLTVRISFLCSMRDLYDY
jgi:hypothetical protein